MSAADLFLRLTRRYLFTGELVLRTALHIGGGDARMGSTDSPVVRRADGQPFIPGSSLKGAFRSAVERLAATLELPNMDRDVLDTGSPWIKEFNQRRRAGGAHGQPWSEDATVAAVAAEWPVTALLFGTHYTASKLRFCDAYLIGSQETIIQRRDGVAIDRDSERAMDRLKYDYEVVPPTLGFAFELVLDNPTPTDLGLTCLGLAELCAGFFSLGGKRSSGLGRCVLERPVGFALDLSDPQKRAERLSNYLLKRTPAEQFTPIANLDAFMETAITALLQGDAHASSTRQ